MALKFNLANQLMSPEQMAGFGQSFGESLGGMGMALGDAWSNYQAEQDKAASIVDPATGRVPSTFESEDTYEDFLQFDETIDDPSFGDVNLGEDIGPIKSFLAQQAEGEELNTTPRAMIGGRVTPDIDTASDIKNMSAIPGASTESIPTQEDKDTFIKEHGIDAFNALVEKRFRMADPGIYSGVGFQQDRRELTKFAGDATNLLGAVSLQDLSKVQNPINYNPETEYNFQQGFKPNILGTALNNLGR